MLWPALGFVSGVWLLQQCELLTKFWFFAGSIQIQEQ